jgi:cyclase
MMISQHSLSNEQGAIVNKVSSHFDALELSPGIYAAIATEGGAGISNAGVIDLGGQTLIFDTFLTPQAAEDLRQFAIAITGRAPEIVINSHYHNDHIWGNQVFLPDAHILSSERTRQLIQTLGSEEFREYSEISAGRLDELQAEYAGETDAKARASLAMWIGYYAGLVEALPNLRMCLPGITFERRLTLHGERQNAELIAFEHGHSGGDTVLHLPESGILFMSDLLFVGCHPYLADGDPQALRAVLNEVQGLQANILVPGHGDPGSPEDLALLIDYIDHSTGTAQALSSEEDIRRLPIPSAFEDWLYTKFYYTNLEFLRKKGG